MLAQNGATVVRAGKTQGDLVFDVRDETQVKTAFESFKKLSDRIDILVHCAGVLHAGALSDQSIASFKEAFDVNVIGIACVTKYAVPFLQKSKAPLIIVLSSGSGYKAKAGLGAYCASKFALRGLTESWHQELKEVGIRITTISPGKVNTTLQRGERAESTRHLMLTTADIAECVRYIVLQPSNVWISDISIRPFQLE